MSNSFVNTLIIAIARKLNISPLVAHILLMCVVTILYGVLGPDGFKDFLAPVFLMIWFGICSLVVLITWVSKGELRSSWTKAEPWQDE